MLISDIFNFVNFKFKAQYSRISSANSIRRPVVKPRQTAANNKTQQDQPAANLAPQAAQQQPSSQNSIPITTNVYSNQSNNQTLAKNIIDEKISEEKPPVYPINFVGQFSGGYSIINQKRKELILKNKTNGANSPKTVATNGAVNSPKSANPSLNNQTPLTPTTPNDTNVTNKPPMSNLSGLNRPQLLQSPNYVQMLPKSTVITTTTTNLNIQPSIYKQPYMEPNPPSMNHNDHHSENSSGIGSHFNNTNAQQHKSAFVFNEKYRLNFTDPPTYGNNNHEQNLNDGKNYSEAQTVPFKPYDPPQAMPQQQYSLTKIPLSPKSNLKSNYYFVPTPTSTKTQPDLEQQQQQYAIKRPFSANLVPNATNIKFGNLASPTNPNNVYLPNNYQNGGKLIEQNRNNSNVTFVNGNNNQQYQPPPSQQQQQQIQISNAHQQSQYHQRIMSADSSNRQMNPT
jgi:hypothetical protein